MRSFRHVKKTNKQKGLPRGSVQSDTSRIKGGVRKGT